MKAKALLVAGLALAAFVGTSASEAQQKTRSLSPSAVNQAAQQHPQILAEFGGEENAARSAYVRSVGVRVASQTNINGGGNAFNVTTLNSPVMNAFAVPGGYLYITRQLLGLMNDEAELASVLGHEAGHIAARHSSERRRTNILGQLGAAILGAVTGSGDLAQIAAQGAQVWVLSYSRSQEYEADDLGVGYMARSGYDPLASPSLLASLGIWSNLETRFQGTDPDQRSLPSWARSHPLSADRVQRATQKAQATGRAGQGLRNRDQHLAAIDGMIFDDDPAQGVIEGRDFLHPDLRLAFTAPQGFGLQNGARAVAITGTSGQAQFGTAPYAGNLAAYVDQVFRQLGGNQTRIPYSRPESTNINGFPAVYATARTRTQQGAVDVGVVAYEFDSRQAFHFVTITRAGTGLGPFTPMIRSLRRLSSQEAAAIRPRIIRIVTVGANDNVQSLAARMAYTSFQRERFLALNGLRDGAVLQRGQRVKLVVYGNRS